MIEGFLIALFIVGAGFILALLLESRYRNWSRRRLILTSALPIPSIILVFCARMAADAAFSPPEKCGVDACGMEIAIATIASAFTAIIVVVSLILNTVAIWIKRKAPTGDNLEDIFG